MDSLHAEMESQAIPIAKSALWVPAGDVRNGGWSDDLSMSIGWVNTRWLNVDQIKLAKDTPLRWGFHYLVCVWGLD